MKKKTIAISCAAAVIISLAQQTAYSSSYTDTAADKEAGCISEKNIFSADTEDPSFGFEELEDGTIMITGYHGSTIPEELIIPETINGRTVTVIGSYIFGTDSEDVEIEDLKRVVLPDTINTICSYAFYRCRTLEEINFPKSLRVIGEGAFQSCSNLRNVALNDGLEIIKDYAFCYCRHIREIDIPSSVKEISEGAFTICPALNKVSIHSDDISIGDLAFGYILSDAQKIKSERMMIYGNKNSCAQKYADENGFGFRLLGSENEPTLPVPEGDGFTWSRDNLNFENNRYYNDKKVIKDLMGEKYINALKENVDNKTYHRIFRDDPAFNSLIDQEWSGSCYGMTVLMMLAHEGIVPYSEYTEDAQCLNDLDLPFYNEDVRSLVLYYHLLQRNKYMFNYMHYIPERSNEENIKDIISKLENNDTVLVSFRGKGGGAHTILAYGYETGTFNKNGITTQGRIKVCDPMHPLYDNDDHYIYFNDTTYEWFIPYYLDNEKYAEPVFTIICADINEINSSGYLKGTKEPDSFDFIPFMKGRIYSSKHYLSAMKKENQGYTETSKVSYDGKNCYHILNDKDTPYKVSADESSTFNLILEYEDIYMTAWANNAESVIFDNEGSVMVEGDDTYYDLSLTFNDDHPTDWFTVRVEGTADHAELSRSEEGYIISADDLSGFNVITNNKYNEAYGEFSTYANKALIYEISPDTIGVKIDKDGDGIFETDVEEGAVSSYIKGDVNGDGKITVTDISKIAAHVKGIKSLEDAAINSADVNSDGKITVTDISKAAAHVKGVKSLD